MAKFWLVALNEFKRHTLKRGFLLALFSVPLLFVIIAILIYLTVVLSRNYTPLGYIDHAGLLTDPLPPPLEEDQRAVPLHPFPTELTAREALDAGEIQAYYVLSPGYSRTGKVELVYYKPPSDGAINQFADFLQINLASDRPADVARRIARGTDVTIRSPTGNREYTPEPTLGQLLPIIASFVFIILIASNAGYLMHVVAEEKENRTMEILITSTSANRLVGGKILGVVAVNLTQLITWIAFAILIIFVAGRLLGMEWFQEAALDSQVVLGIVAVWIPAYLLIAALMTAVSATVAEGQEAGPVTAIFTMPLVAPFWFFALIVEHPDGPLAIALSLFPLTAPNTMALRLVLMDIPLWQIAASVGVLSLCAAGAIWLAGRAFRLGMLRYGQRLKWGELFRQAKVGLAAGDPHA